MTQSGKTCEKATPLINLFPPKSITKIGKCNIHTLYEPGKMAEVTKEMHRYKLDMPK